MFRRRHRWGRGFRSRRGLRPRWVGFSTDVTLATGTAAQTEWLRGGIAQFATANLEGEIVVRRMVGFVKIQQLANLAAAGSIGWGVIRTQNLTVTLGGFHDPLVASELGNRDWMHVKNFDWGANTFNNGLALQEHGFDIRVNRRLETDDTISMVSTNPAAQVSVLVTIDVRILIVVKM